MTTATTFELERRLFVFAAPGAIAAAAIVLLVLAAAWAGKTSVAETVRAQEAFQAEQNASLSEWRDALETIERDGEASSPYNARPMNISMPAILPPAPLADFASGAADLHPTTTTISGWSNPVNLFIEYEFDNPTPLSLGGLDLTFLAVVLMPLIMIAASFDVLAGDRDLGRARLVALQAGHVRSSVWERLAIRNGVVWAAFSTAALVVAIIPTPNADIGARLAHFLAWMFVALIYGGFWFGCIALASVVLKKGETVAAALFAAWAAFVFAAPAVGGAFAEAFYPPPSRLAFLSEMRKGEVAAVRETAELTAGFLADHPEMTVSDEAVPGYYANSFLANREAEKRTTPVLEGFEASREQRAQLVSILQFLSPAMIADRALTSIAGGDVARAMNYQRQARAALFDLRDKIGPAVVAKQRISLAEFDAIERFGFEDRTLTDLLRSSAAPLIYLALVAGGLITYARKRLAAPLEQLL
ncbi:MAG: DUF3526 domain-containing protein [Pseudomonadota bacterium]